MGYTFCKDDQMAYGILCVSVVNRMRLCMHQIILCNVYSI
jgi:hypothetical protein